MNKIITLFILTLFFNSTSFADSDTPDVPTSQSKVIKLTDTGIEPANVTMKLEDSIVFVLNNTNSSLMTTEIDYGGKTTHCASSNMSVTQNSLIKSKRPIGPNDFASVCFHDRGRYPFKVSGAEGKLYSGIITVE